MNLPSKRDTKGSIIIEASIALPIFLLMILAVVTVFDTLDIHSKVLRCLHESVKTTIADNADHSLFKGIIEDMIKREILKDRFQNNLLSEMEFRQIEDKVSDIDVDFTEMFLHGESEGKIKLGFEINGISFSESVYIKALSDGIYKEKVWKDIWHLEPMLRGRIIISRFGGNMDMFFELISRFKDGEACVIKSLDPDLDTYSSKGAVYERIAPFIQRLYEYSAPIDGIAVRSKRLILIIPQDARNIYLADEIKNIMNECEYRDISFDCIPYGSLYE